tara:strand:+ start:237 stop:563 length:327 start_codon:yes stop_codon:yes gene_type:complete
MNTFHQALENLSGGWHCWIEGADEYENVHWTGEETKKPTKDELLAEVARLKKEKYKYERTGEPFDGEMPTTEGIYPPMDKQLDYIYHHGIDKWKKDMIDPVKAKYPKP